MTAVTLTGPAGELDLPRLVDLCRTEAPDLVANTREEAMRRAEYMRGRGRGFVVAELMRARVVEWEMAHRWPAKGGGRDGRADDRPVIAGTDSSNQDAWKFIYAVGARDFDWITSRTDPEELTQAAVIRGGRTGYSGENTGAFEFYTPPAIVEPARTVMGGIDLDPASSPVAQQTIRAGQYFTQDDDGLTRPWRGRVWMNPPFRAGLCGQFVGKLVEEFHDGNVTQAVTVTHNATETRWAQALMRDAAAVCFPAGRINFHDSTGKPRTDSGALQGQMIVHLSRDHDARARFIAAFGHIGVIV